MKIIFLIFISLLTATIAKAQIKGCTDPQSLNYDASATINNGSCTYPLTTAEPLSSLDLPETVKETSGLIIWNNALLTHNDDTDNSLYAIDSTTGKITASYPIPGFANTDWEEISQDEDYIYVGDFGNNSHGNRTDLKILRISKASLLAQKPVVTAISFSYEKQTTFTAAAANTTNFDCEAFIVTSDAIYLFTKEWSSQLSTIYKLPKVPGNYIAKAQGVLNTKGMITGATYLKDKKLIALSGYDAIVSPFVFLLYDYSGQDFLSGNKRKIEVPLLFHQIEGIASSDGLIYYLTNEKLLYKGFVDIAAQLHVLDLSKYIGGYIGK